jgi:two-component system phosphate regulon response regulator PhoB
MRPHALIVEDDEPLSIVLRYNLEAEGFAVTAAASAEEAELVIRASPPDLIVLDWALPGRSGIAFCRDLRSRPETRHIGILLLTAKAEDADRERGLAAGADVFLVKPFSLEHLISSIRSCLAPVRSSIAGMHAVEA